MPISHIRVCGTESAFWQEADDGPMLWPCDSEESQTEFRPPGFDLAQSQLLWALGAVTGRW